MRAIIFGVLACAVLSCGGSRSSTGGSSGAEWKETGTSADGFMKTALTAEQEFAGITATYREAFLYVSLLITNPTDAVGKDYRSALVFAESTGSQFQTPDQLTANFSAQQSLIQQTIRSDRDVLRVLQDLSRELPPLKATLTQLNETSKNLIDRGQNVHDGIGKETTDQASATMIRTRVSQMTDKMKSIHEKAPAQLEHISQLIDAIGQVSVGLQ